ncbi:hypothetical protein [Bradyrhizobium tropiciagri]|uniref:hypothetical protein n=1 Tax=Bradyrhizobium tropiciagri TaxID=312253 RepID=UPI000AE8B40E|nr:hypothetical protein [Bradyrhizobium tropiciagri]
MSTLNELAPTSWRPVLKRARGHLFSGEVGGESISWSIGTKGLDDRDAKSVRRQAL